MSDTPHIRNEKVEKLINDLLSKTPSKDEQAIELLMIRLKLLTRPDVAAACAQLYHQHYHALLSVGFSPDQAISIMTKGAYNVT